MEIPSARRQHPVSDRLDTADMTTLDDSEILLRRLVGGDVRASAEIVDRARISTIPTMLVAAAILTDGAGDLLARAGATATTTRDRQLVAIAAAHVDANDDLLDALVRDHLADHPDNVLAAWIAATPTRTHHQEQP